MRTLHVNSIIICTVLVAIVTGGIVYVFNPAEYSFYPPCLFKKITGFDCAGCGSTRALHALLHGDILKAANHNLLFMIVLPVIATGLLNHLTYKARGFWNAINKPLLFVILVSIFWVLRNIDHYPFTYLHSSR